MSELSILTANVRAIGNKIDEIQLVAELNSVGAICVTETWLSSTVPDSNITIPGLFGLRPNRYFWRWSVYLFEKYNTV